MHREACRVMTNGDREGWIFLSHSHTNSGFFSCSPLNTPFKVLCVRLQEYAIFICLSIVFEPELIRFFAYKVEKPQLKI